MPDFDVVVIGSGFGGAIMAARLAERGSKVLVLERGRWWDSKAGTERTKYPRELLDPWIWDQDEPEHQNGWLDFRHFRDMSVVQGAAVGGGSLIYANISAEAPEVAFRDGWPADITFRDLKPHSDRVAKTMDVQELPKLQWAKRTQLVEDAAKAVGAPERFRRLQLAVKFNPDGQSNEPGDPAAVPRRPNEHGVMQGTCAHTGECDMGCPADAKSTLDRNYLAIGQKYGLEIRQLHLVTNIEQDGDAFVVHFDRLANGQRMAGRVSGRKVVVAAGSLGSTELLLRCRDQHGSLPRISAQLGYGWCSNGDFLTPAFYPGRVIDPGNGPTITAAIDYLDGKDGSYYWIQDGGFVNLLKQQAIRARHRRHRNWLSRLLTNTLAEAADVVDPFSRIMPWFAQGIDSPDGQMRLRKRFFFFGRRRLDLRWDVTNSKAVIEAIIARHKELSARTGGIAMVPLTWRWAKDLITPHPLGGCCMGQSAEDGVVDHRGEVFGYPGLFVVDGAIVPRPIGVNPSRTIGALAERAAALFS